MRSRTSSNISGECICVLFFYTFIISLLLVGIFSNNGNSQGPLLAWKNTDDIRTSIKSRFGNGNKSSISTKWWRIYWRINQYQLLETDSVFMVLVNYSGQFRNNICWNPFSSFGDEAWTWVFLLPTLYVK